MSTISWIAPTVTISFNDTDSALVQRIFDSNPNALTEVIDNWFRVRSAELISKDISTIQTYLAHADTSTITQVINVLSTASGVKISGTPSQV